ncbi:MAG: serine hydrolase [Acidimicrobiia bacterium]
MGVLLGPLRRHTNVLVHYGRPDAADGGPGPALGVITLEPPASAPALVPAERAAAPEEARPSKPAPRDPFLDVVRALALARVMLWHTIGAPILTFFLAAVPTMFFVTGSLLAKSMAGRDPWTVTIDRLRRILIPFWAYGVFVFSVIVVSHWFDGTSDTGLPLRQFVPWIVPLTDPHASTWEAGYLTGPLWYLRALVWLLLAAPLLFRMVRRWPTASLVAPLLGLVVSEYFLRRGIGGVLNWQIGDLFLYGFFLMLGFRHREGRFDGVARRYWLAAATMSTAVATGAFIAQPIAGGVVNDSHSAHLLVGLAWLAVIMAARPWLVGAATLPVVGAYVRLVSRRSLTIYLWHPAGIVATYFALRPLGRLPWMLHSVLLVAGTVCVTAAALVAAGWIEDVANRRDAQVWPAEVRRRAGIHAKIRRRSPILVHGVAVAGVTIVVLAATVNVRPAFDARTGLQARDLWSAPVDERPIALRVPSQQPRFVPPPSTLVDPIKIKASKTATIVAVPGTDRSELLAREVNAFFATQDIAGVQVSVLRGGAIEWNYADGFDETGRTFSVTTPTDISSATKSFTAALVWRAVEAGLIDLDAPLPPLDAVPSFPYSSVLTARSLLDHRSGLVNYRDTPKYSQYGPVDARDAVTWAGELPLRFSAGSQSEYSSVNYLVLGLLLEQVTHRTYDDLLTELLRDVDLAGAAHSPPRPGQPNGATAGILMSSRDLARWSIAFTSAAGNAIGETSRTSMLAGVDTQTGLGAGIEGFGPVRDGNGGTRWTAYGYAGASSIFHYTPSTGVAVAMNITGSLHESDARFGAAMALLDQLASLAAVGQG